MSDYNKYVIAVNKIFEIVSKMKSNWKDQDNISYLESIEEYKQVVIDNAKTFSNIQPKKVQTMEELGDD